MSDQPLASRHATTRPIRHEALKDTLNRAAEALLMAYMQDDPSFAQVYVDDGALSLVIVAEARSGQLSLNVVVGDVMAVLHGGDLIENPAGFREGNHPPAS